MLVTAVLDVAGQPERAVTVDGDFDQARLATVPQDTTGGTYLDATGTSLILQGRTGIALRDLMTASGVDPAGVGRIDVLQPTVGQPPGALATDAGDLAEPGDPAFPFTYDALPLIVTASDVSLYVGQRTIVNAATHPTLSNGTYFTATDGQTLRVVLHLTSTLAHPTISTASTTVSAGAEVTFTGSVDDIDPGSTKTWTWDFGDGTTLGPSSAADARHTYPAAGAYPVTLTVAGSNGSRGTQSLTMTVTGATSSPPPSTSPPPTGPDLGSGGSTAPNVGPRTASGPRAGGAVTAPAGGRPGPSTVLQSQSGAATASGTAEAADGTVVGYLLADPDPAGLVAPRAAATRRDPAASPARAGSEPTSLPGWLLAVAAAVLLSGLGAWTERRRPTDPHVRTRPRRKR